MKNKILIVDDISDNISVLDNILSVNYDILVSTNGRRAIELAKTQSPDLILLDIVMPDMDGIEVCKILKNDKDTQNIPIIFLTSKTDDESIVEGFKQGAVDYITKPFKSAELLVRLNTHLSLLNYQRFLEEKVQDEIALRHEQEQLLVQNSKMAEMGDMINNIAHQWRQPVNRVSLLMSNIKMYVNDDQVDKEYINKKISSALNQLDFISETIDDFSNFFHPSKNKTDFYVLSAINKTLKILIGTFKSFGIEITVKGDDFSTYGIENELAQVILILLSNAKDAMVLQKIENPEITIIMDSKQNSIEILDNGGGIDTSIINQIFDHYFTTKLKNEGSGIGLYTAKVIIQKTFNGKIFVNNKAKGASFTLVFNRE